MRNRIVFALNKVPNSGPLYWWYRMLRARARRRALLAIGGVAVVSSGMTCAVVAVAHLSIDNAALSMTGYLLTWVGFVAITRALGMVDQQRKPVDAGLDR